MGEIEHLNTPKLLLDRDRMQSNLRRMARHIQSLGCTLRPHVKTHKSHEVLHDALSVGGISGITVSTLHEAEYFFADGQRDILYAVSITPAKVIQAAQLIRQGAWLKIITDSVAMAKLAGEQAEALGLTIPILIELDVDGHRSGIKPSSDELLEVARTIEDSDGLILQGVMTHAGASYDCESLEAIHACALQEQEQTVMAAQRLRDAGFACETVSIGSTPTALLTENLKGITEVRAGVYTFFDLYQAGLGVASVNDIALSVLATVIGHQEDKSWVIVDAGWMAMSRDRGTAKQSIDQGYGLVCDLAGQAYPDVIMGGANQEHGILMARVGEVPLDVTRFPLNSKVRILPNHACATAAQYSAYQVLEEGSVSAQWSRTNGF